jgi:hypothetical protein
MNHCTHRTPLTSNRRFLRGTEGTATGVTPTVGYRRDSRRYQLGNSIPRGGTLKKNTLAQHRANRPAAFCGLAIGQVSILRGKPDPQIHHWLRPVRAPHRPRRWQLSYITNGISRRPIAGNSNKRAYLSASAPWSADDESRSSGRRGSRGRKGSVDHRYVHEREM